VTWNLGIAAALMAVGVWLHLTERHDHEHVHEALEHEHARRHVHAPLRHRHPHYPDLHHRHGHEE
jgi:hypothetical protein